MPRKRREVQLTSIRPLWRPANLEQLGYWAIEAAYVVRQSIFYRNPPDNDELGRLWQDLAAYTAAMLPAVEARVYHYDILEESRHGCDGSLHLHILGLLDRLIPPLDTAVEQQEARASETSKLPTAATTSGEGKEPESEPGQRKRGTERGEGRAKLIAALTKHHRYAEGSCLNLDPIGNNDLAKAACVSPSTASAFFNNEFQGHTKYKALCRGAGGLVTALKLLNGEFAPFNLYDRQPPGEGNNDDE